ncbi:TonB-dependent receptor plug domain-containing protein [Teredinibacter purpureus]|uniref:TonB-dependent receptor plug domain-containing protein n=1 Tax=Teredinibacter purpureus TaxID=2731756 RepID=UPI00069811E2|nr:TonB-dependent receptor [Teredinibacter purpureus]
MSKQGVVVRHLTSLLLVSAVLNCRAEDYLYDLSLEDLLQLTITSASKVSDVVRDVPASVTIITRDDISLMGYASLEELLMNVPGFYHIDTYEDFQVGVRGTVGGSLAFLINGVQQHPTRIKTLTVPNRSRSNLPIQAIDRIEIIRGPSSVIYGNNAFLGSINIITNDKQQGTTASVSIGENGYSSGYLRVLQESDRGYSVLNIGASRTKGIGGNLNEVMSEEQLNRELMSPEMYQRLDGTLEQETFSAEMSGRLDTLEYGFRYSDMHYGFYALFPGFEDGSKIDLTSWVGHVGYELSLSDAYKVNISGVASNEKYFVDPDFIIPSIRGYQNQNSNRIELEGLLSYDASEQLKWLIGVNYRQMRHVQNNGDFFEIGYFNLAETESIVNLAAFSNVTYKVSERWELTGGYRHAYVGDYDAIFTALDEGGETLNEPFSVDRRNDEAVKLASNWRFTDQDAVKVIYSTATQDNSSIELLEPEQMKTYELNYLHTGKKNTVSVSLFDNDIRNVRRRVVRYNGDQVEDVLDNQSHWQTKGVEAIITTRPTRNLMAEVSGVYQTSKDLIAPGATVGYSPQSQMKFKLGYGVDAWRYSTSLVYVSDMHSTFGIDYREENPDDQIQYLGSPVDSYLLVNANIRYQRESKPWFVNMHGFNLTDSDIRYPANELADFEYGAFGPGCQIVLTFGIDL